MRHNWISVIFHLSAVPLGGFATPLSPRWEDMVLKHSWNVTPEDWECLGLPPATTIIDLHVALKPHREEALIDTLNEVSNPNHPKHVFSTILRSPSTHLFRFSDMAGT